MAPFTHNEIKCGLNAAGLTSLTHRSKSLQPHNISCSCAYQQGHPQCCTSQKKTCHSFAHEPAKTWRATFSELHSVYFKGSTQRWSLLSTYLEDCVTFSFQGYSKIDQKNKSPKTNKHTKKTSRIGSGTNTWTKLTLLGRLSVKFQLGLILQRPYFTNWS